MEIDNHRHPVRDAAILAVAAAALLSCVITAAFHRPPKAAPNPGAERAAAEAKQARAFAKLSISLRVAAEFWLKDRLKDPDSFEAIRWSAPSKTAEGTWLIAVRYRARNSFGGMTIESRIFTLDQDANVIDSRDVTGLAE